jgi:hypothetical protein
MPALPFLNITFFSHAGMCCRASSDSTLGGILQNSDPWLLMTFEERVGGTAEQQRQFFEIHVSALKPWVFPLSLSLLLTSVTTKGALAHFLFRKAAEIDIELFK